MAENENNNHPLATIPRGRADSRLGMTGHRNRRHGMSDRIYRPVFRRQEGAGDHRPPLYVRRSAFRPAKSTPVTVSSSAPWAERDRKPAAHCAGPPAAPHNEPTAGLRNARGELARTGWYASAGSGLGPETRSGRWPASTSNSDGSTALWPEIGSRTPHKITKFVKISDPGSTKW